MNSAIEKEPAPYSPLYFVRGKETWGQIKNIHGVPLAVLDLNFLYIIFIIINIVIIKESIFSFSTLLLS